jgi:hypothetical protein
VAATTRATTRIWPSPQAEARSIKRAAQTTPASAAALYYSHEAGAKFAQHARGKEVCGSADAERYQEVTVCVNTV